MACSTEPSCLKPYAPGLMGFLGVARLSSWLLELRLALAGMARPGQRELVRSKVPKFTSVSWLLY